VVRRIETNRRLRAARKSIMVYRHSCAPKYPRTGKYAASRTVRFPNNANPRGRHRGNAANVFPDRKDHTVFFSMRLEHFYYGNDVELPRRRQGDSA
jgi:hypothetical protein